MRRSNPQTVTGKRGAVSYEDMFKNTKILTHNNDTEGNPVRVEGIVEFNKETKSFSVFWETEDEPPLLELSKQDMDVLVANSKHLDFAGLIKFYIGHTVVTNHSFWKNELIICYTDKYSVPIIIQYDVMMPLNREDKKLGDSLVINMEIAPEVLTKILQLKLVAYDDESVYIKYVTGYIQNSDLKIELSFTRMNRVEYEKLDETYNLGAIDETRHWPVWYKKYKVRDEYSTEFMKYVRVYDKYN